MNVRVLICDAGPLILLAKLGLISKWFVELGYKPVVLDIVVQEMRRGPFIVGEEEAIEDFLKQIQVESAPMFKEIKGSLSPQDHASLHYAKTHAPAILLADDLLLRRSAKQLALPVIGFLGLLTQALKKDLISAKEAKCLLDDAVALHGYRISISLYQAVRKTIDASLK